MNIATLYNEPRVYGYTLPAMARRWNSADLLNITPDIIGKILNNTAALAAVKKIQGFANPRSDLASSVNRALACVYGTVPFRRIARTQETGKGTHYGQCGRACRHGR